MTSSGDEKFAARWRAGNFLVIARRWMEPQCSPASLPRIPDRNHLLRINDPLRSASARLASAAASSGAFSFLRSAAHCKNVTSNNQMPATSANGAAIGAGECDDFC
jgi:hypothetical protein